MKLSKESRKLRKIQKKQNSDVAYFMLDEVGYEPEISVREKAFNIFLMYVTSLMTVVCVMWASLNCCKLNVEVFKLFFLITVIHTLIFGAFYYNATRGRYRYVTLLFIVYTALIVVFRNVCQEGLLYIVDSYIDIFNNYKGENYYVNSSFSLSEEAAVFWILVTLAAGMLFIINYIFVCYMSIALYTMATLPWIMLPLFAGEVPKLMPFVIYVGLYVSLLCTRTVEKKRTNAKLARNNNFHKAFVDAPACKMIVSGIVCFSIVMTTVWVTLPDKLKNKKYLVERHKNFENNAKDNIDKAQEKYSVNLKWLDKLLDAENEKKSKQSVNEKNKVNVPDSDTDKKIDWSNVSNWFYETADNDKLMALYNKIEKQFVDSGKAFYKGYDHGNLKKYASEAKLNTSKYYELFVEKTQFPVESQYIKNFQSVNYENGLWKSVDIDSDIYYLISDTNREFSINSNNYRKKSLDDYLHFRCCRLVAADKNMKDSVYNYIRDTYYNYALNEENGKLACSYKICDDNMMNNITAPHELERIRDKFEQVLNEYYVLEKDIEEDYEDDYGEYFEEDYDSDISYLKDQRYKKIIEAFTQIPDEVEQIRDWTRKEYKKNGGVYEDNYLTNNVDTLGDDSRMYMKNFDYTVNAVNFVADTLSNGYYYTLKPKNNENTEPVVDFLFNTHEGFCMHFASAATFMLRSLGIPTRYVEGYMVSKSDINKAFADSDNGDYGKVDIYGTDAHAWIEVYIEGIGWVPQEMTLGTTKSGLNFSQAANEYRVNEENKEEVEPTIKPEPTQETDDIDDETDTDNYTKENDKVEDNKSLNISKSIKTLIITVTGISSSIVLFILILLLLKRKRKRFRRKLKNTKTAYRFINKRLMKFANKKGVYFREDTNYEDFAREFAKSDENISEENALKFMAIARKSVYSKEGIICDDVDTLRNIYNEYMKNETGKWNSIKRFVRVKLKGEIVKL